MDHPQKAEKVTADSMWGPGSREDFLEEGAVAFPLGLRIRRVTQAAEGDPGSRMSRQAAWKLGRDSGAGEGAQNRRKGSGLTSELLKPQARDVRFSPLALGAMGDSEVGGSPDRYVPGEGLYKL